MLCLFRNSQIHPRLDPAAVALSWAATLYWLYFAFIEKALLGKIQSGEAIIVDLVFGLPLVLAFAVMIYATIYWSLKLLLVLLWPAGLVDKSSLVDPKEDALGVIREDEWRQVDGSKAIKPSSDSAPNTKDKESK